MACLFIDLDGSAFKWGTNEFLPGAYEQLKAFYDAGNQIIFTTQRDMWMNDLPSVEDTSKFLSGLFPKCKTLWGITSPRIVLNDAGAIAINHQSNAEWNYDLNVIAINGQR